MSYFERIQTARKEHRCDGSPDDVTTCRKPIVPGMRYVVWAIPPWQDYETDVDDEGRTIGVLRDENERRWSTFRRHLGCRP